MVDVTTRFGELTGLEAAPTEATRPAPVLFVHGWYRSFAINLRGYHDSKRVADIGKVTFDDHVDDIRAAVEALGEPILITHSAAGHFALKFAEQRTLATTIHLVPTPPAGFFSLRTVRVMAPYLPKIFRGQPVLLNKRDMFDADLNCLPADEQESVYAKMVPAPGTQGRQMLRVSVDAKKVAGARLVVSGTEDRLTPSRIHRAIARKYGADYREYPRHGHYLMREPGWERIADDLIDWLDGRAA